MKKLILVLASILMVCLIAGCGVSQQVHDAVLAERDTAQAEVASLESDLANAQSQVDTLESDLDRAESQIETLESDAAEAETYAEFLELAYAEFLDIPVYQTWLRVEVDQEFVIPLVSNPTTGYGWQVSYDETMLELVDKTYELGVAARQGVVGAGGTELFRFRVLVEMGQTEITLVYKRPWEEPSPQDITKVFTVNVVPTVIIVE